MNTDTPCLTMLRLTPDTAKADARALHTLIAYAAGNSAAEPRTLWCRPENDVVIVQAQQLDLSKLPGVVAASSASIPVRTEWAAGQHIHVDLIVNLRRRHENQFLPVPDSERTDWLKQRLPCLDLVRIDVRRLPILHAHKRGHRIALTRAAFSADATVINPDELRRLILAGVGGGKAYGCGLLIITETNR